MNRNDYIVDYNGNQNENSILSNFNGSIQLEKNCLWIEYYAETVGEVKDVYELL